MIIHYLLKLLVTLLLFNHACGQCTISSFLADTKPDNSDYERCVDNSAAITFNTSPAKTLDAYIVDANTTDMSGVTVPSGTTVSATCDAGYTLDPSGSQMTCTGTAWTGTLGECVAGDCQEVFRVATGTGTVTYTGEVAGFTEWVAHGGTAALSCATGYTLASGTKALVNCYKGKWVDPANTATGAVLGYCAENGCVPIPSDSDPNTGITGYTSGQTEATPATNPQVASTGAYNHCPTGYKLPVDTGTGTADLALVYTVVCDLGQWESNDVVPSPLVACQPLGCPANLMEVYGDVTLVDGSKPTMTLSGAKDADGLVPHLSTATLACPAGYTASDAAKLQATCTLGQWVLPAGGLATCDANDCAVSLLNHCPTTPADSTLAFEPSTVTCATANAPTGTAVAVSCDSATQVLNTDQASGLTCVAGVWKGPAGSTDNTLATCQDMPCCACWADSAATVEYFDASDTALTSPTEIPQGGKVTVTCTAGGVPTTITCGTIDVGLWDATPSACP